jgi:hypothetical protein
VQLRVHVGVLCGCGCCDTGALTSVLVLAKSYIIASWVAGCTCATKPMAHTQKGGTGLLCRSARARLHPPITLPLITRMHSLFVMEALQQTANRRLQRQFAIQGAHPLALEVVVLASCGCEIEQRLSQMLEAGLPSHPWLHSPSKSHSPAHSLPQRPRIPGGELETSCKSSNKISPS